MTPLPAPPDPPDPRFPVYDPHPHPLDLLAYRLIPALGDPHWSGPPCCVPTSRRPGRSAPRRFGPVQLATYLGLEQWQLDRAVGDGLIPGPDRSRGRWSAPIADAALARIGVIRAAAGSIPDLGAVRAAGVLSARLGLEVTADGVEELARRDLLPVTGSYKQHALYDGRALEAFTDTGAAIEATRAGTCAPPTRPPTTCVSGAAT